MSSWTYNLVQRLAEVSLANVFNPYSDRCPLHDSEEAATIRRCNLASILTASYAHGADSIWFGRDLGYRGGRRTGLSLTDEARMHRFGELLPDARVSKATIGPAVAERTATTIWSIIERMSAPPILWNAFPLHPHLPDVPMSNRSHTANERRQTAWCIHELVEHVRPRTLIAIGNDAAHALADLGLEFRTVRHPSYGGTKDFIRGMEQILGLGSDEAKSLPLIALTKN